VLRTSFTDPLSIDELPWPGSAGGIGLTLCPGKHEPDPLFARWARDLEADADAVRRWGAVAVLTLLTGEELLALGVPALGAALRARDIEWHHVPIPDGHAPGPAFERAWPWVRQRLLGHLARDGRVLIHCKGGLGRAGTVAARMLVESGGLAPREAVGAVRTARPGAVETDPQWRHVSTCTPVAPARLLRESRLLGCLLGGAVGDAFGYAVEFDPLEQIRARHGPEGLREPVLRAGRLVVSDDTQMTLFTLEGLLRARDAGARDVRPFLREAYLDWWLTQQPGPASRWPFAPHGTLALDPALQACRAPGMTCLSALSAGGTGSRGQPPNDSKGCGTVMRSAPFGFGVVVDSAVDGPDAAAEMAADAAAITHGHPEALASSAAFAAGMRRLFLAGTAACGDAGDLTLLEHALLGARHEAAAWERAPRTGDLLEMAAALALQGPAAPREHAVRMAVLGKGWVAEEALAIGALAALAGEDFSDSVRIAANHDGDSDSTASVAGQLRGAACGAAGLPHAWVEKLDVLEPMLELVARA
jgi:ADP-ribosylglycohydrolase/protein-tyrosine phosphatase